MCPLPTAPAPGCPGCSRVWAEILEYRPVGPPDPSRGSSTGSRGGGGRPRTRALLLPSLQAGAGLRCRPSRRRVQGVRRARGGGRWPGAAFPSPGRGLVRAASASPDRWPLVSGCGRAPGARRCFSARPGSPRGPPSRAARRPHQGRRGAAAGKLLRPGFKEEKRPSGSGPEPQPRAFPGRASPAGRARAARERPRGRGPSAPAGRLGPLRLRSGRSRAARPRAPAASARLRRPLGNVPAALRPRPCGRRRPGRALPRVAPALRPPEFPGVCKFYSFAGSSSPGRRRGALSQRAGACRPRAGPAGPRPPPAARRATGEDARGSPGGAGTRRPGRRDAAPRSVAAERCLFKLPVPFKSLLALLLLCTDIWFSVYLFLTFSQFDSSGFVSLQFY